MPRGWLGGGRNCYVKPKSSAKTLINSHYTYYTKMWICSHTPPKKINKTKQKDQSSSSPFVLIFKIFQRNPRMVPSHDYSRVHCSWRSMFIIPTLPKSSVVHGPSLALSCRRHIARSFTAGSLACLFSIHRSNADCLWSLPDIKF